MLGLRRRSLLWVTASALLWVGCLSSPTLPLPPPSPEQPTVPVDGQTQIAGTVPGNEIGVRVLALNARTHQIFGESTVSTRFSFLAAAQSGDTFVIWYTIGEEESESTEVTVPFRPAPFPPGGSAPDAGCSTCTDATVGDQ